MFTIFQSDLQSSRSFAHHWNGFIEVNHIDVKIPSEHTVCGKEYAAELQIFMLHPIRRQTIVMSILMELDPSDKDNAHFQKAIREWQKVSDANHDKCVTPDTKRENTYDLDVMFQSLSTQVATQSEGFDLLNETSASQLLQTTVSNGTHRNLRDTTPFGRGGWDPFHPSLEKVS